MFFLDVAKTKCTLTSANQKRWTLTTANRMLRNCQEDIRLCYEIRGRTINMTLGMLFLLGNKSYEDDNNYKMIIITTTTLIIIHYMYQPFTYTYLYCIHVFVI